MADGGFSSIDHWQAPVVQLTFVAQEHDEINQQIYDTSPLIAVPIQTLSISVRLFILLLFVSSDLKTNCNFTRKYCILHSVAPRD